MPVQQQAVRFKQQLLSLETEAQNQLISAYQLLIQRLNTNLQQLETDLENLSLRGELSRTKVIQLNSFVSLLTQLEAELNRFGNYSYTQGIDIDSQRYMQLATEHSRGLVFDQIRFNQSLIDPFNATWDSLPVEELKTLLGFLQSDSQLVANLTRDLGSTSAQMFQDQLLEGIGLGLNPREITRRINNALGQPLTWVLNSVRTTNLYAYREASRANYLQNDEIVSGWYWYASLDARVCLSCVNQHGRFYPLTQQLNDHHSGRCTPIPSVKNLEQLGLQPLEIQSGESWFRGLPEVEQIQRMGIARHEAFIRNEFQFNELTEEYDNDVFGVMRKETPLNRLVYD